MLCIGTCRTACRGVRWCLLSREAESVQQSSNVGYVCCFGAKMHVAGQWSAASFVFSCGQRFGIMRTMVAAAPLPVCVCPIHIPLHRTLSSIGYTSPTTVSDSLACCNHPVHLAPRTSQPPAAREGGAPGSHQAPGGSSGTPAAAALPTALTQSDYGLEKWVMWFEPFCWWRTSAVQHPSGIPAVTSLVIASHPLSLCTCTLLR